MGVVAGLKLLPLGYYCTEHQSAFLGILVMGKQSSQ